MHVIIYIMSLEMLIEEKKTKKEAYYMAKAMLHGRQQACCLPTKPSSADSCAVRAKNSYDLFVKIFIYGYHVESIRKFESHYSSV